MQDDVRVTMSGGTGGPFFVGGRSRLEASGGALFTVELFEEGVAQFVTRDALFDGSHVRGTWLDGTTFQTQVIDPMGTNGQLMPDGLCLSISGVSHCGPTVFYRMDYLRLFAQQSAIIEAGADISQVDMYEQAHVSLRGGAVRFISLRDDTTVDMTGGLLQQAFVMGRGQLTVSGGQFADGNDSVYLAEDGRVDVVVRQARYDFGRLEGEWADGTAFRMSVRSETGGNQFMPNGMCVVRGTDTFCGATLFFESGAQYFLGGTDRVAVVDGALLGSLWAQGEAVVDVRGGTASEVAMLENSHLAMSGGHLRNVYVNDDASADLLGGRVDQLFVRHRGIVTLSDMEGLSFIDLTGLDGGHVTVKVLAATFSGGGVVGTWLNGSAFELFFHGVDDANVASKMSVVAVPEPATWLSMALGLGALVGVRLRSRVKMCKGVMTGASGMKREEEHGVA